MTDMDEVNGDIILYEQSVLFMLYGNCNAFVIFLNFPEVLVFVIENANKLC